MSSDEETAMIRETVAKFVDRELEYRPRHRNAGVVDEAEERFAVKRGADLAGGGQYRGLVGDVEQ